MRVLLIIIVIGLLLLLLRTIVVMARSMMSPPPAPMAEKGYYGDGIEVNGAVTDLYYIQTIEQADDHIAANAYDKALPLLEYLDKNWESHVEVHARLASVHVQLHHPAPALQHFQVLLELEPEQIDHRVNIAFCYLLLGAV